MGNDLTIDEVRHAVDLMFECKLAKYKGSPPSKQTKLTPRQHSFLLHLLSDREFDHVMAVWGRIMEWDDSKDGWLRRAFHKAAHASQASSLSED